ncbi:trypsin-like serine protease [Microdochium trichocladiopsis]|uniref:Trypsin-like serine protease n=1 Tax=Microdochium trichocladiopsis TaxID=1682393 RepID=A0A9P9BLH1_9PEZI|nr:trypsin-like serine protease [Microdochium trichocladiopsis]KAH7024912.1 trypsin-like serine protease [Microdochium trichocladiopsis]
MIPNYKLTAVLAVLPALSAASPIVGGTTAKEGAFPFLVSLSNNGKHFCGGSLLNATTVLTAAHCSVYQSTANARVRAGTLDWTSGGVEVGVSSILVNRNYGMASKNNDIALWYLDAPIETSADIAYATLPAAGSDPEVGTMVTIAGWGATASGNTTSPTNMLQVTIPVSDRESCQATYGNWNGAEVTDQMFCAGFPEGGKGSCQGDSGGPVVDAQSKTLLGVVSWADGCAQAGRPGVYTRVGQFIDWIKENTA